jgi:hypothetical protein
VELGFVSFQWKETNHGLHLRDCALRNCINNTSVPPRFSSPSSSKVANMIRARPRCHIVCDATATPIFGVHMRESFFAAAPDISPWDCVGLRRNRDLTTRSPQLRQMKSTDINQVPKIEECLRAMKNVCVRSRSAIQQTGRERLAGYLAYGLLKKRIVDGSRD